MATAQGMGNRNRLATLLRLQLHSLEHRPRLVGVETSLWLVRPVLLKSMRQHFLDIVHGTGEILSYVLAIPKWGLVAFLSLFALLAGIVAVVTLGLILGLSGAQEGLCQKGDA